jgi:2'-5' RNA ligase
MNDPESADAGDAELARLFVALDPPEWVVGEIISWQASQADRRSGGRLAPVPAGSLHLTLAFLGDCRVASIDAIGESLEGLASEPIEAALLPDPVPVPRRRPKLFALGLQSPGVLRLQVEVAQRLREIGVYRPERRPFWPHLTAFRVRKRPRDPGSGARIPRLGPIRPEGGHAFGFVRVALYRSDLRPEGASYSRLAANELPQAGGRQKR